MSDDLKVKILDRLRRAGAEQEVVELVLEVFRDEEEWQDLVLDIQDASPGFFDLLGYAGLGNTEVRACAYIRAGKSSEEISMLLGIQKNTLRTLKYRVKKKLNLGKEDDLRLFLDGT